jgi:hypothetical protein
MAVFGVPRVNEDDAERAVRVAFGMQESLARSSATMGIVLLAVCRSGDSDRTSCKDDVDPGPHELCRTCGQARWHTAAVQLHNLDSIPFEVAELGEPLLEHLVKESSDRLAAEDTNVKRFCCRLRLGGERLGEEAARHVRRSDTLAPIDARMMCQSEAVRASDNGSPMEGVRH